MSRRRTKRNDAQSRSRMRSFIERKEERDFLASQSPDRYVPYNYYLDGRSEVIDIKSSKTGRIKTRNAADVDVTAYDMDGNIIPLNEESIAARSWGKRWRV